MRWQSRVRQSVLASMAIISLILAGPTVGLDDELYYALGGGVPIARSASNRDITVTVGTGVTWSSDLMCGNFDMSISVQDQLNGLKGAFSDLMGNVINSATGAVASLPALLIQKLNPALYDLLQNGVLQASEEYHIAKTSCEDIVGRIGDVIDSGGWGALSKGGYWGSKSQESDAEILEVLGNVDTQGMDHGVVWVDGQMRGGSAQPPIEIVGDTSKAGYNLLVNRSPGNSTSMTSTCDGAAICELWGSPQEHAEWLIQILGEQTIRTCQSCDHLETQAGMGLSKAFENEQEQIETDLIALVLSGGPPSQDELDAVSGGPSLKIHRRVIEAIREEREQEQGAIIRRLAGEMAMNRTMEKALIARRSLLAGMMEPNIANVDLATERLQKFVNELNIEIENMLFELDVRSRLASNTASQLLMRNRNRQRAPVLEAQHTGEFSNGSVPN